MSSTDTTTTELPAQVTDESFIAPGNAVQQQLTSTTWVWGRTVLNDELVIMPYETDAFTLSFAPNGAVRGTTDCNAINSIYTLDNGVLTIEPASVTPKYCEGSQELIFTDFFTDSSPVLFNADWSLTLPLLFDRGSVYLNRETISNELFILVFGDLF